MWQQHRPLFIALLILTAARLVLAGTLELSPDEAYYHLWTKHMDWSFYSKGPGAATAIWLGTHVFGDNAFGIRFWSPLLGLGTSLMLYRLARGMYDGNTAAWSVVLLNVTPIFNAGSIVMTIDPPSVFFWTCTLVLLWSALHRATPWAWHWPLAGLAFAPDGRDGASNRVTAPDVRLRFDRKGMLVILPADCLDLAIRALLEAEVHP